MCAPQYDFAGLLMIRRAAREAFRCRGFAHNVSSMMLLNQFSRQMQTILL
jgi:hypothetical protein